MKLLEIEIPGEFVEVAGHWYSGQYDLLYAVSSTGGLCLGNIRPINDETGEYCSDQEWHLQLWRELSCDIAYAARMAEKAVIHDTENFDAASEAETLRNFEKFANETIEKLANAYGLEI